MGAIRAVRRVSGGRHGLAERSARRLRLGKRVTGGQYRYFGGRVGTAEGRMARKSCEPATVVGSRAGGEEVEGSAPRSTAAASVAVRLLQGQPDSRGPSAAIPEHEIHLGEYGNNSHVDPSPTFRRSCRDVICGSWAMNIDCDNGLVCFTEVPSFCHAYRTKDRAKLDGMYESILCACCSTSYPSYWWNPETYPGPAALLLSNSLMTDIQNSIARLR
ncbi:succinate dehydrogenase ubiquinone iron-sulfur subunit, partial [Musa troglodytarum]